MGAGISCQFCNIPFNINYLSCSEKANYDPQSQLKQNNNISLNNNDNTTYPFTANTSNIKEDTEKQNSNDNVNDNQDLNQNVITVLSSYRDQPENNLSFSNSTYSDEVIINSNNTNIPEEFEINFHDHAINIFCTINNVRTESDKYIDKLKILLNKIKMDSQGKYFITLEHCTYVFKSNHKEIKSSLEFLQAVNRLYMEKNNVDSKGCISNNKQNSPNSLLWSENIYQSCLEHLNFDQNDDKNLFQRISSKYEEVVKCLELIQDGLMDPELTVLIMLIDQVDHREDIFCKNFDIGAACCSWINSEMKARTIVVLTTVVIKKKENKKLNFNHPAFDNINYKPMIVSQKYKYEDHNMVVATFELTNGKIKQERVQINNI